jgi:hypothetical protein
MHGTGSAARIGKALLVVVVEQSLLIRVEVAVVVRSSGSGILLGSTGQHRRAAQARQRKSRVEERRARPRACECDKR